MSSSSEIESLVYLLEDPDPYVQDKVRSRLFELGEQAVPLLDQQKNNTQDEGERELISEIIRWITYSSVENDFMDVVSGGLNNLKELEDAIFILSRFNNPTLRASEYKKKLDRFAETIGDEVRYALDDSQKMHVVLDYVFAELDFSGSTKDYYNPENSYLNCVIDRRQGLPITLSLIVLFIGRRLQLPFHGINMPIHFMLTYQGEMEEVLIDPFDHGKLVDYSQCYYFLKQNGIDPKSKHFSVASEITILARCIRNLINSYEKLDQLDTAENLKNLLSTVETIAAQH
ncbi:Regulator of sirC expression, contains transglutaminase-like and TPR domains [Fodinibius salinus]|uniref:Regulator of sirC expression, contains transglutaminase-like and TPR domains n=1 Tax=Fodinibius salinus TaxID=860790 RepID=A0A5D3YK46_9BACT|nr:transglutaminase-like domain-containing protein [Fodinibius salinus]TYP93865.1 Regulator of sirC expression, contains transglutaminase-like and TPR domains [Fodinibius salinus]